MVYRQQCMRHHHRFIFRNKTKKTERNNKTAEGYQTAEGCNKGEQEMK